MINSLIHIMSMFGFKSKKGEVLNHWISFAENFVLSPQEFYSHFEKELKSRDIPGMDTFRVEFGEGGLLSNRRTYMRMVRERLAFDTCAASFGNIYFFSCRTVFFPPVLQAWHILSLSFCFASVFQMLLVLLGFQFAVISFVLLVVAIVQVLQNAVIMGLADVDAVLIKIPAVGPIYELFFRKETYYREDTRLLYLKLLPDLVKELAEETTAAKGVKLRQQYERAPILGELYRPVNPRDSANPEHAIDPRSSF